MRGSSARTWHATDAVSDFKHLFVTSEVPDVSQTVTQGHSDLCCSCCRLLAWIRACSGHILSMHGPQGRAGSRTGAALLGRSMLMQNFLQTYVSWTAFLVFRGLLYAIADKKIDFSVFAKAAIGPWDRREKITKAVFKMTTKIFAFCICIAYVFPGATWDSLGVWDLKGFLVKALLEGPWFEWIPS